VRPLSTDKDVASCEPDGCNHRRRLQSTIVGHHRQRRWPRDTAVDFPTRFLPRRSPETAADLLGQRSLSTFSSMDLAVSEHDCSICGTSAPCATRAA